MAKKKQSKPKKKSVKRSSGAKKGEDKKQKKARRPKNPTSDVYPIYVFWKSLPTPLIRKGMSDDELDKLGFDDPRIRELAQIKTQGEFAEEFGINEATLSGWNKTMQDRDALSDIREWAKPLTKNVALATYEGATRQSRTSPTDRKLFFQIINGWKEETKQEHDMSKSLAGLLLKLHNGNSGNKETEGEDTK